MNRKKRCVGVKRDLDGEGEVPRLDSDGLRGTAGGACQLDPEAVGCQLVEC